MTFKILHFSDLHLDTSFAGQGFPLEYGVERRLDLRAGLTRILARARELKVDAITIGGDLYDEEYLLPETANFLQQQFALLAPIRVIIAPGEKDPYTSDSPYARLNWSENVDIFYQRKLASLELSADIHLWGACNPQSYDKNFFGDFKPANGINLLLLHVPQKTISNNIDTINQQGVVNSGFNIALLGGEHIVDVGPSSSPVCIYPGTPEPLNQFEENGLHRFVLIEVNDQKVNTHSYEIRQWHYSIVQIDVSKFSSNMEAAGQINNLLEKETKRAPRSAITIEFRGRPQFDLNLSSLRDLIQSNTFFRFESHIDIGYNLEQLANEQTVRGLLVQHFLERIKKATNESERNRELTALNIALQALEGKQVSLYEVKPN